MRNISEHTRLKRVKENKGRRMISGDLLERDIMIRALFIDIDDTVLDFAGYVKETMKTGFAEFGLPVYEPWMYDVFHEENSKLWQGLERGEIAFEDIKRDRWNKIFAALGISMDGRVFEDYFRACLHDSGILIPGAKETLEDLSERYLLFVASNGPDEQQRNRLKVAGINDLFIDVFTSGEIGASKPTKEFFDKCIEKVNRFTDQNNIRKLDKNEILMVGDSLTSDISGAVEYGLKSCLFDPSGRLFGKQQGVDYEIRNWSELKSILT